MAGALATSVSSTVNKVLGTILTLSSSPSKPRDPCNTDEADLAKLTRTLQRIQSVLTDAEEREILDESVKLWVRELKDLAYDIDNVLDEHHYELLRREVNRRSSTENASRGKGVLDEGDRQQQQVCITPPASSPLCLSMSSPEGIRDRIRDTERFDEIAKDRNALKLRKEDGVRINDDSIKRPPTSSHLDDSHVFGREDDRQKIIELLLSEDVFSSSTDRFHVIPIVGMGGLGKTTLAQLVYNHPTVRQHFGARSWLSISEDFDVVRLTKALVRSLTNESCEDQELTELQDTLKKEVGTGTGTGTGTGKRYLLVLDDVWSERLTLWESLLAPFSGAATVKIIVTTQSEGVASVMQTVPPYRLHCLPEEQCLLLFRNYAFADPFSSQHANLSEIGRKIVQKCGGLPLAVKALGCLLRYESDEERWLDILRSDLWELDEARNEVLPALRLSYNRMPPHLKPCFLYASLFPKKHCFHRDMLIRLWIAQGYIQPKGSRRLKDIGSQYFDDLRRRSFFQTADYNQHGNEEKFKLHDMVHDLARSISGKEIISAMKDKTEFFRIIDGARHLFLMFNPSESESQTFKVLRTLILTSHVKFSDHNLWLGKLCNLRVLSIGFHGILELPASIGNLKQLRVLSIKSMDMELLHESVCLLYNLQTLDLKDCSRIRELPEKIGDLISLHFLRIHSVALKTVPASVSQLNKLHTLDLEFCRKLQTVPTSVLSLVLLSGLHLVLPPKLEHHRTRTLQIIRSDSQMQSKRNFVKSIRNFGTQSEQDLVRSNSNKRTFSSSSFGNFSSLGPHRNSDTQGQL